MQVHQREPCNHQEAKSCYLKAEALMKANGVRIPQTTSAQNTSAKDTLTACHPPLLTLLSCPYPPQEPVPYSLYHNLGTLSHHAKELHEAKDYYLQALHTFQGTPPLTICHRACPPVFGITLCAQKVPSSHPPSNPPSSLWCSEWCA